MSKRKIFPFVLVLMAAGGVIALAAGSSAIYYHGQIMSQDTLSINGRVYVPLSDVARALGGRVAPHGSGYEIVTGQGASSSSDASRTAPGGANEVRGTNGNIGDWFFNGYWRFRVSKVERAASYSYLYFPGGGVANPDGPNDELVVVSCTMKNGEQSSDEPILTRNGLGSQKTALTDDQGQSYPPEYFDVRGGNLAPGAAKNFAVVFSIPKGTTLKDMIFTVYSFGASNKASNVRVSMAGQ